MFGKNKITPSEPLGYTDIHLYDKLVSSGFTTTKSSKKSSKTEKKHTNSKESARVKKKCSKICFFLFGVLVKLCGVLCIVALALGLTFGLLSFKKKGYTEICKQTIDCDVNAGLLCDNTSYICNCPDDYFYNFTTYTCQQQYKYGNYCIGDFQCQDSLYLTCQNQKCKCPTSLGWMWSSRAQNCIICPGGWVVLGDHCFNVFFGFVNFTTALSTCQNNNSTLLMISSLNDFIWTQNLYYYRYSNWLWMGAVATAPKRFNWLYDNSTLTNCSPYWCPGSPDNSYGNASFVGDGCLFMGSANGSPCIFDFKCNTTALAACERDYIDLHRFENFSKF